jgi:uncharacterized protein (DUF697 family)
VGRAAALHYPEDATGVCGSGFRPDPLRREEDHGMSDKAGKAAGAAAPVETVSVETIEIVLTPAERLEKADALVKTYAKWAAAGGLVPVPMLDFAAVAAVQIRMLEKLSHLYGVTFKENIGKELIATLVATSLPYNVAAGTAISFSAFIRFVPVVGQLFGLAILPAFAGASTFALGRVFIKHFESGGTFLDFDLDAAKSSFKSEVEGARRDLVGEGKAAA